MDRDYLSQENLAVATKNGLITFVGPEDLLDKRRVEKARSVDLDGRLLMPGMIESHGHLFGAGFTRLGLDLRGLDSLDETQAVIERAVADTKSGEWIVGSGWDHTRWPGGQFPDRQDLDRISTENPVMLMRVGGHSIWVNSLALELAGVTAGTPDPDGGIIARDKDGVATGILVDNAFTLVEDFYMDAIGSNPLKLLKAAQQEAFENGITTFHDMGFPAGYLPVYKWLARFGVLKLNTRVYVAADDDLNKYIGQNPPGSVGDDRLRIGGIKMIADGAMGSFGALLSEPYSDRPGDVGLQTTSDARMMEIAELARDYNYQLAVHSIGDLANSKVIEVYSETIGPDPEYRYRWRIEHAQFLRPEDIFTIGSSGYIPVMQPRHATTDMKWVQSRLGDERGKTTYAWRSLINAGAIIPGGSDVPVEPLNPIWGIYAAVTRQDHQGLPIGGFNPEERVSREEALQMYTTWGAFAGFDEESTGRISEGLYADLIILNHDISRVSEPQLLDSFVEQTYVRGVLVYHH